VNRRDLILALTGLAVAPPPHRCAGFYRPMPMHGINHVSLVVTDMDRSVEFYQRVLEMPVQCVQPSGTNLSAGDGTQFIGI